MRVTWMLALIATGCVGDLDPVWQLDHDRVVAVRATPPHILAGSAAVLDGLVAHKGSDLAMLTDVESPTIAAVSPLMPMSLQGAVVPDGSGWQVVAPSQDVLDAARAEMMLGSGDSIPLAVGMIFGSGDLADVGSNGLVGSGLFAATKIVVLGDASDNPVVSGTLVNGVNVEGSAAITIPPIVDVPIQTDVGSDGDTVEWLTSCGTMHDDNEIKTFMTIGSGDPTSGELAVVHRDGSGGVAWETWPIASSGGSAQ